MKTPVKHKLAGPPLTALAVIGMLFAGAGAASASVRPVAHPLDRIVIAARASGAACPVAHPLSRVVICAPVAGPGKAASATASRVAAKLAGLPTVTRHATGYSRYQDFGSA